MTTDWLDELNDAQRAAASYTGGPLLILAGAGSGKTRVLTYRVAYLLSAAAVPPEGILAVTFTNKAAREMRERVARLVGPAAEQVWVGTFHATCVQILRRHADRLGFPRQFLIFDTADQIAAVKECLKDLNLDPKRFEPRSILAAISGAKNELADPEQVSRRASDFWERTVARVYERYQAKLKENGAFDFDDLILMTVKLLEREPDLLARYQERFVHLLIDEYQDTNRAQYVLVNMLASRHRNLCVVGDADQSIYRFRGADIRNILDFQRDYPDARVIKLEQNYRSTKRIVEAANRVIANNLERPDKTLWTANPPGDRLQFFAAEDEREEAAFVADEIRDGAARGRPYRDFAILYRTHAQSRTFEEEFIRRGVPYRIVSGVRFYERREIKDLLAYLRLVFNPYDGFSLRRIVNVPKRGIGDATLGRLEEYAAATGLPLFEAMGDDEALASLSSALAARVRAFYEMVTNWRAAVGKISLTALAERILNESGYLQELAAQRTVEAEGRAENLREFLSVTRQFEEEQGGDLGAFLEHVALVSDVDAYDSAADSVTLMTLHAAKGLEFPVVFLVGMEEGVFPHSRAVMEPGQLEEERRLCYVGMTRAMERLYLTCARRRLLYGEPVAGQVSRFVGEIPEELLEDRTADRRAEAHRAGWVVLPGGAARRRAGELNAPFRKAAASSPSAASSPGAPVSLSPGALRSPGGSAGGGAEAAFRPGDRVRHRVFGSGTVVSCEASGPDTVLTVAFPGQGVKKLLAGLAPLEKL
ncbi:MAG: DNA helicase PcrA [Firmicutes bacterium]|nr:DNA helicase PcrA [Bacillota bacterium]